MASRGLDFRVNDEVESIYEDGIGVVTGTSAMFVYVRWAGDDVDCVEEPRTLTVVTPAPEPQLSIYDIPGV